MFGAEMRSIGCAFEYGSQGIKFLDGAGVQLRLFATNFNHVGSGKDFTNDITITSQADEVIGTNGGEVSYVSIDQSGNFRVGEAFFVNQETGNVSFAATTYALDVTGDIDITDGTNTANLSATSFRVGNLQFSGNTVSSTSGDVTINPSAFNQTNITGDLDVSGTLTASVVNVTALQQGDTSIAISDTGSNGSITLNTEGAAALSIDNSQNITLSSNLIVDGNSTFNSYVDFASNDYIKVTVGTSAQRPTGVGQTFGQIRYNTDLSTFEGFGAGSAWGSLGGVKDVDGDTYIKPEVSAGSDEDTLYFYANNTNVISVTETNTTISNNLNVTSIATFTNNIDANGDLDVDGNTELDATNISETLNVDGVATFANNIDANGDLDVAGNTVLGSSPLNTITFGGDIASAMIPDTNSTRNLGANSARWSQLYVNQINASDTLDVTGASTFANSVNIGPYDITSATGTGLQLSHGGIFKAQRSTTAAIFEGYQGTTKN